MSPKLLASSILSQSYDQHIAEHVLASYLEIESNYFVGKWKASELDAGHFVEAVRRLIELQLKGTYTAFDDKLSSFSDGVLKQYEQATGHDESYRMLIPRALKAVFNIRNKRGVGHISGVSPNEMDSTFILFTVKWVLAELIRLNSTMSIPETQTLVDTIVERSAPLVWRTDSFERILEPDMSSREQVLVLLYEQSPRSSEELRSIIEYKNKSDFNKLLGKMHKNRFVELRPNGACFLSPTGSIEAERIIKSYRNGT